LPSEVTAVSEPVDLDSPRGEHSDSSHLHDDLQAEYFKLVDLVSAFDQRLLTIKGWGVTLSLASLGIGFQQGHYGLFLVAAISAVAFWLVEGATKIHQMCYYPRMGDIEVASFNLFRADTRDGPVSSPLIDWAWHTASARVVGGPSKGDPYRPEPWPKSVNRSGLAILRGLRPLTFPHVVFPHVVSFAAGTTLFVIGLSGHLGHI